MLGMKQRIWVEKLNLAQFIRRSGSKSLSGKIYIEQLEQGWPCLAREVGEICDVIKVSHVNHNDVPKWMIKQAVTKHHAAEAHEQMGEKLKDINDEEIVKVKDYMETHCITDCRLQFRIRTNMVDLKANMKGRYRDLDYSCLGCGDKATVEDQSHVLRCPAYKDSRQGLDLNKDEDVVKYFKKVMILRMKKKL